MKSAAFNPAGTLKLMSTFTLVFWSVILIIGTFFKENANSHDCYYFKDIRCFGFVYLLLPYKATIKDLKNAKY